MRKNWIQRGKKGIEQEKDYMNLHTRCEENFADIEKKIDYLNEVMNTEEYDKVLSGQILNFIKNKNLFSSDFELNLKLPIEVDMKDISPNISGKKLDKNIKKYNKQVVRIIDAYNKFDRIDELSFREGDQFNFIYVVQRNDGMVAVVGKSSFYRENQTKGDLYYRLDTNRLVGTENIILRTLMGDELSVELDKLLVNYYKKAWIIPIPVPKNTKNKVKIDSFVKGYEKELGEYLIDNGIQILNYYSHT